MKPSDPERVVWRHLPFVQGSRIRVFTPDGAFRPLAWFPSQHVVRLFRAEVLRMLLGKELITEAVVDNLLSWSHSGFSAHGGVRVEDRQRRKAAGWEAPPKHRAGRMTTSSPDMLV